MAKVSLRAYNRDIEAMIDQGRLDEAIAHCQHILKTYPKHLETYRLLGKAYLESRKHNEAVDIFSRVLVCEPSDFVAQVGMSIIRDEQNKLDDAIWHMERAFEAQPSNAAIQGELQRLYGRRDGVQPPRIRMTRGALAHMYMQGELYPQAISETRSVLSEDSGRTDMQNLLAKAYYRSGQKNDAADAASTVLKRYPYCLDANRVLADILGADRPDAAQTYLKRVIELDPYAAHVNASLFHSKEVNEAAVTIEQLDWNGQTSGTGWSSSQSIGLGSGSEQPDWLKNTGLPESTTPPPTSSPFASTTGSLSSAPAESSSSGSLENIPDFLRDAGWGESTGAFDESQPSMFEDEPAATATPITQGDLPDWVKAMAPPTEESSSQGEEEMPDWINKIGTGALPIPPESESSGDQTDWLSNLGDTSSSNDSASDDDDQGDWMRGFGAETESAQETSAGDRPDWLGQLGGESESEVDESAFDFLNESSQASQSENAAAAGNAGSLGASQDEQDASLAWLEGLAAKQGATEGLLVKPEDRLEDEPDWIKQAKGLNSDQSSSPSQSTPSTPVPADTGNLGASQDEQDASLAWLEGLAAKQGATEGLLVKPEDRLEDEPDWVKQVKSTGAQEQSPVTPPPSQSELASIDTGSLGTSQDEQDASLAWLEGLAAKQGATEGLLVNPEDRLADEPDWVKQAKQSSQSEPPVQQHPVKQEEPVQEEEPDWMQHARSVGEQFFDDSMGLPEEDEVKQPKIQKTSTSAEDVSSWLRGLDDEEESEKSTAEDETTTWLNSLDETESPAAQESDDDMPSWMKDVPQEKISVAESDVPEREVEIPSDEVPGWLNSLDEEEESGVPATDDFPAWMRDETGEVVAEPTRIEPTRSSDWTPIDTSKSEETPPPPSKPVPEPRQKPPAKKPAAQKPEAKPAPIPAYKEPVTRKGTGTLAMPVDPVLGSARAELSRSNIPGALETYEKLIKKGRFLEDVIYDLREALYRYPVEVSIWQTLGDAYMRANQLQDALDAYTKAEELLR